MKNNSKKSFVGTMCNGIWTLTGMLLSILLLAITGCKGDGSEPGEQPHRPPEVENCCDFERELDDNVPRIEAKSLSLRYGDAGVMVSGTTDGSIDYEIRDIGNGHFMTFQADNLIGEGTLENPALRIDDADVALTSASLKKVDGDTRWFHLVTIADEHIVIVVPGR